MSSFIENIEKKRYGALMDEDGIKNITVKDIEEFGKFYQEIVELQKEYDMAITGRNELGDKIKEKLSVVKSFLYYLNNQTELLINQHSKELISDYELALRVILRLANQKEQKYDLRKYFTTDLVSFEKKLGDREFFESLGKVWIIGEKNILDEMVTENCYTDSNLGIKNTQIIKGGNSLIVLANNIYPQKVEPFYYHTEGVEYFRLKVSGTSGDMSCYVFDDELKEAILQFNRFINKNGTDIKGIDEDKLFETIIQDDNRLQQEKNGPVLAKKLN